MTGKTSTLIFKGVVTALVLLTLLFGYYGYALYGFLDSVFFIPPAVSIATDQGFTNHVTDLRSSWGDPSGAERYLYFPPFFPLLIGSFISSAFPLSPPAQAFFFAGLLVALTVFLIALVFYKIATLHGRAFGGFAVALIIAILVIMLRSEWTFMMRPETLENLLLALAFLLAFKTRAPRRLALGFGAILGLMAATHPFGTAFFAIFIGLFFSFFYEGTRRVATYAFATYITGIFVFLFVMFLSPYGVGATISGVLRHASVENQRIGFGLLASFVGSPFALLYGIAMLFVAGFCIHFYLRYRTQVKTPPLFFAFATAIALLTAYSAVLGVKTYYASLFSVLVFPILVYYLVHVASNQLVRRATLFFFVLFAALSLKPVLAFPSFVREGMRMTEARRLFAPIASRYPSAEIFVAGNLWTLSDEYKRMHVIGDITEEQRIKKPLIVALDQIYTYGSWNPGTEPSPEAEGCPLVEDHFVKNLPHLFGFTVSHTVPGYGFAAYVCE